MTEPDRDSEPEAISPSGDEPWHLSAVRALGRATRWAKDEAARVGHGVAEVAEAATRRQRLDPLLDRLAAMLVDGQADREQLAASDEFWSVLEQLAGEVRSAPTEVATEAPTEAPIDKSPTREEEERDE